MVREETFSHRWLATLFLAGVGATAAWSSLGGVAPGDVSLVPCPVHAITGIPCPGCGITRACVAVARADFGAAWGLHPFALLLVPLAVAFAVSPGWTRATWGSLPRALRGLAMGTALASCIGLWLSRAL